MSRKLSWGIAAGTTLLISLTGCSQQAGTGGPTDVCGLLAAPVTAQLVAHGITATPVDDGTSTGCRWQDQASSTTVTLTALDSPATTKDGQTLDVAGVGEVAVLGPGELGFTAGGRSWDLKVDTSNPDDVDTQIATDVVTAAGAVLQGAGVPGSGQGAPTAAPQAGGGASSGTEQKDATVTVTDENNRTTDLRLSTVRVTAVDGIALGNGQTVPQDRIARVEFSDNGDVSNMAVTVTLTDGATVTGNVFRYEGVEGGSDLGAFRQLVSKLKSVEFRRDTPFVATPAPQLPPFASATATVVERTGTTSKVKAPSLRFVADPGVTLDNGQSVLFEKIARIDAKLTSPDVVTVDITLVTGQKVSGGIDAHIPVEGDTDGGILSTTPDQLTSITFGRGPGGS
ncbi:MAG: hypothetical protein L0H84_00580 [Pseudonocardia sp.]|nr:hypothetical protein [Pseudonocardia sp.]